MPYNTTTLQQFISQVSDLLDDPDQRYWTAQEIMFATYECLMLWGGSTNYWRARGAFNVGPYVQQFVGPALPVPYQDLSVVLPALRTRVYTLDQMVREIQYMLLEPANGLSGANMSGQTSLSSILKSIQDARNRFVRDAQLPYTSHPNFAADPTAQGVVQFDKTCVYLHRAVWQDAVSAQRTVLARQDAFLADSSNQNWTTQPGNPAEYSESELSPLQLQLVPPPISVGSIDAITVDSLVVDVTNQNSTFNIPDEWVHAIKYAAVAQVLSTNGQITDPLRADYAEKRYQQSVDLAKSAQSVIRVLVNGVPVPLDPISLWDVADPFWMNAYGPPTAAAALRDFVVLVPALLDNTYGVAVDVARTAPLPALTDYMPVGEEELDTFKDYVTHILLFKCGGKDFTSTIAGYDSFMDAVKLRNGANAAKIQYLEPLFNQPQRETSIRPEVREAQSA